MNKSKILFLFLLLICIKTQAQLDSISVFRVEYDRVLTPENTINSIHSSYLLQIFVEPNISVFDKISASENTGEVIKDKDEDSAIYHTPKGENNNLIYKDYASNTLFSKQDIALKYFVIKDSLSVFDWEIYEDTKEILGFTCQLAKMDFRGRSYTAWFNPELPVGGPWKYDGLPGMILSLADDEGFIAYEAVGIKNIKTKFTEIQNPHNLNKTIFWQEFKALYKKNAIDLSKYSTDSNGSVRVITQRRGIERYIEEEDMDYTADKEFQKRQQGKN